jgi:hypothetical protein
MKVRTVQLRDRKIKCYSEQRPDWGTLPEPTSITHFSKSLSAIKIGIL